MSLSLFLSISLCLCLSLSLSLSLYIYITLTLCIFLSVSIIFGTMSYIQRQRFVQQHHKTRSKNRTKSRSNQLYNVFTAMNVSLSTLSSSAGTSSKQFFVPRLRSFFPKSPPSSLWGKYIELGGLDIVRYLQKEENDGII